MITIGKSRPSEGEKLLVSKFNQVLKIDPTSGALEGGFNASLFNIFGLEKGSVRLVDRDQQSVFEGTLAGLF